MVKKRIIGIAVLAMIIGLMIWLYMLYGKKLVAFVSDFDRFQAWIKEIGIWGRVAIVGMVTFQIIVAVIPAGPFEIAAGYAYGPLEGTLLYVVGATVASVIIMLLVRVFGTKFIRLFISQEKIDSVDFIHNTKKLGRWLLIFFLVPGTPKDVVTYVVGLTSLKVVPWALINLIGRFPAAFLTILCGDALSNKNYLLAGIYVGACAILCGLGAFFYYRYRRKKKALEAGMTIEEYKAAEAEKKKEKKKAKKAKQAKKAKKKD